MTWETVHWLADVREYTVLFLDWATRFYLLDQLILEQQSSCDLYNVWTCITISAGRKLKERVTALYVSFVFDRLGAWSINVRKFKWTNATKSKYLAWNMLYYSNCETLQEINKSNYLNGTSQHFTQKRFLFDIEMLRIRAEYSVSYIICIHKHLSIIYACKCFYFNI